MADPFSIIAGTFGILDISYRVLKTLNDVRAGALKVDDELESLVQDIKTFRKVIEDVKDAFTPSTPSLPPTSRARSCSPRPDSSHDLWRDVESTLAQCHGVLANLEKFLKTIVGDETNTGLRGKFNTFKRQLRVQAKQEELNKLQRKLGSYQAVLQISLTALSL